MPQTNFINTTSLDPSTQALQDQITLQRQQQLAQMMQQQAMEPIQSPNPNARMSPLQGLNKMLQGYTAGQARNKSDQLMISQIQNQNAQLDRMFGIPPAGSSMGGGAMPASGAAPPSSAPPQLAPPPADPNAQSVEPPVQRDPGQTLSNALAQPPAGQPAQGMAPPAQGLPPQQAPQGGSMLPSLTGDPRRDRLIASQVGLPKYLEMASAQYAPTDQAKNDARVGITPAQRKQMDVRESLKQLMLPNAPGILNADANGNPVYQALPGLTGGIAEQAGATKGAQEANTPHYEPDPLHPGQFHVSYPPTPPALQPQPGAPVGGQPQAPAPVAHMPATAADLEAMKSGAQEGVKYAAKLTDDASTALQGKRTLGEMQNLLQNFTPGQFAPVLGGLGAAAQSLGVSPDLVKSLTGINPGDAQAFQKGTATLASEAAKQVSNRVTQMEFKIFLANNPNWMMQPDGIKRVIDFMGKGFDQTLDKQQAFSQFSRTAPPDRWQTDFESNWNQQQRAAIKAGATNSVPSQLTGVRTAADVAGGKPINQFTEGQTATDPATGRRYQFQGGKWSEMPAMPARPGQQ